MHDQVRSAIAVFCNHQNSDDDALIDALVDAGFDRSLANRLFGFMPIAFTHVLMADSGVTFSKFFLAREGPPRPLMDEPVYRAALDVARSGIAQNDFLAVAGRSSDLAAINEALHDGAQLSNLVSGPTLLMMLDDSESAVTPRKRWWEIWK